MKFTKKEQSLVPTKELLNEIQKSIACKQPEQLVMLGSSDRKHIDTVFFVDKSKSTQTSCEPDIEVCNKKIREWYEKTLHSADLHIRTQALILSYPTLTLNMPIGLWKPSTWKVSNFQS